MSGLTKTLTFNSKEELDRWLRENEGKTNYVVKDEAGNKLKEGKVGVGSGLWGGIKDFLGDAFIRPAQVAGVGLVEGFGNLVGNEDIKRSARNYARQNLPVSWLEDYEKDPFATTGWNVLDTVLTYGTMGVGGAVSKGVKGAIAAARGATSALKGANLLDKGVDLTKAVRGAQSTTGITKSPELLSKFQPAKTAFSLPEGAALPPRVSLPPRGLMPPTLEVPVGTATTTLKYSDNPQLYNLITNLRKVREEAEAVSKIPKLPLRTVDTGQGHLLVFNTTGEVLEYLDKVKDSFKKAGLLSDWIPPRVDSLVKSAPKSRITEDIFQRLFRGQASPVGALTQGVSRNADDLGEAVMTTAGRKRVEDFLEKLKAVNESLDGKKTSVSDIINAIKNRLPRVNPVIANAAQGALSYEMSTPSNDKSAEGLLAAAGLGAASPTLTKWAGRLLGLGAGNVIGAGQAQTTKVINPRYPRSQMSGRAVSRLSERDASRIITKVVKNSPSELLEIPIDPVTKRPDYSFGNSPVDKLRTLSSWLMWSPSKTDKLPSEDLDFTKAALTKLYNIVESKLGVPVMVNAENNETLLKALEKARQTAVTLANKEGPVPIKRVTEGLRKIIIPEKKLEELKQKYPEETLDEKIREAVANFVKTVPIAVTPSSRLGVLARAIEAGEDINVSLVDDAIKELNKITKGKTSNLKDMAIIKNAEALKEVLKGIQVEKVPNIEQWDKLYTGLDKYLRKPGSGSVKGASWYWGSWPAIFRSMTKPAVELISNVAVSAGAKTDASKAGEKYVKSITRGAATPTVAEAAGSFLDRLRGVAPYMSGNLIATNESREDKLAAEQVANPLNISGYLKEEEEALERQANAELQNYYNQKRQELENLRIGIFQEALKNGLTVSNAEKLANFYVENELKNINNAMKRARLTVEEQKQKLRAHLGLKGVEVIKDLAKDPATVNMITLYHALTPGPLNVLRPPEVQLFEVAILQITEAMSRALSGAAIKEDEMQRFLRMVPRFGDTQQTLEYKIKALESFFNETLPELERQKNATLVIGDEGIDRDVLLENKDIILDNIK